MSRTLHVAALPFPTYQGTQALLHQMLQASSALGRESHLLCYAASGRAWSGDYTVHRVGDFPKLRSLRSGPSLTKVLLDARMAGSFARQVRSLSPGLVVAHHVEAAALCLPHRRTLFFAHTDLGAELPSYAPPRHAEALRSAGNLLDRALAAGSAAVATVSPWLQEHFARLVGAERVRYVPAPWPLPAPLLAQERAAAREALGLPASARVALYAGNLDAYQSWPTLIEALARADRRLELLVASVADARELWARARAAGVAGRVRVLPLDAEGMRRRAHAAADFVVVTRGARGGIPIKLLDAMALGMPCAVMPSAGAGLPLGDAVRMAQSDDAVALAAQVDALGRDAMLRKTLSERARHYVATHHDRTVYQRAFDGIAAVALGKGS